MHDGASPHLPAVRALLNNVFPLQQRERDRRVAWAARCPDQNPVEFYLRGLLCNRRQWRPQLATKDTQAILYRVRQSLFICGTSCFKFQGEHFWAFSLAFRRPQIGCFGCLIFVYYFYDVLWCKFSLCRYGSAFFFHSVYTVGDTLWLVTCAGYSLTHVLVIQCLADGVSCETVWM